MDYKTLAESYFTVNEGGYCSWKLWLWHKSDSIEIDKDDVYLQGAQLCLSQHLEVKQLLCWWSSSLSFKSLPSAFSSWKEPELDVEFLKFDELSNKVSNIYFDTYRFLKNLSKELNNKNLASNLLFH